MKQWIDSTIIAVPRGYLMASGVLMIIVSFAAMLTLFAFGKVYHGLAAFVFGLLWTTATLILEKRRAKIELSSAGMTPLVADTRGAGS